LDNGFEESSLAAEKSEENMKRKYFLILDFDIQGILFGQTEKAICDIVNNWVRKCDKNGEIRWVVELSQIIFEYN